MLTEVIINYEKSSHQKYVFDIHLFFDVFEWRWRNDWKADQEDVGLRVTANHKKFNYFGKYHNSALTPII
jgi:hypothetical protein